MLLTYSPGLNIVSVLQPVQKAAVPQVSQANLFGLPLTVSDMMKRRIFFYPFRCCFD